MTACNRPEEASMELHFDCAWPRVAHPKRSCIGIRADDVVQFPVAVVQSHSGFSSYSVRKQPSGNEVPECPTTVRIVIVWTRASFQEAKASSERLQNSVG